MNKKRIILSFIISFILSFVLVWVSRGYSIYYFGDFEFSLILITAMWLLLTPLVITATSYRKRGLFLKVNLVIFLCVIAVDSIPFVLSSIFYGSSYGYGGVLGTFFPYYGNYFTLYSINIIVSALVSLLLSLVLTGVILFGQWLNKLRKVVRDSDSVIK